MKNKLPILLVLVTVFVLSVALTACDGNTQGKLTSGNVTAEGNFAEGVTLAANKVDKSDDNYTAAINKIADKDYDKDKVAVYDISLVYHNAKVQPDGKVRITMPAPFETANGYVTYHIKGEVVEELATTLSDGKISFTTDGFSYFVVAATTGGSVIGPGGLTPNDPTKNFFAYVDTFEQATMTANGTDVPKGGYSATLKEGDTVELIARAKEGYQIVGWYKNEKASGSDEKYDVMSNPATFTYHGPDKMFVYARFDVITYEITFILNGGEFDEVDIPETYNVESDTITLPIPKKGTAEFLGWTDSDGNPVTEIAKGSTGDITLTANWKGPKYVRVDKDQQPAENGEYLLFGSYPQTAVDKNDKTTLSALNELAGTNPSDGYNGKWTSYKYYYAKLSEDDRWEPDNAIDFMWYIDVNYKGEQYRGVYFDKYRPAAATGSYNVLKDGKTESISCDQITNRYYVDNVYWFKYEPILWKIVGEADGKARLLCMTALDCQPYTLAIRNGTESLHDEVRNDDYKLCYNDSPGVPTGILGTDYEHSTVRDWLNNCFYQNAFDSAEQSIVCDTVVDNVTGDVGNNTTDKVFIPSVAEVKDEENLLRKASDYAKSQGTSMQYADSSYCYSWYLRDTYYVLRFQDGKDIYVQDHKRYHQLCSVNGGTLYAKKDVPCSTGADGTSTAVIPSLWITL